MARFVRWMADLVEKRHLHYLQINMAAQEWQHYRGALNTTLLTNANNEPMAILNIARDITERRRLSVELQWKNKQIELLNRIMSYANTTMDMDKIFSAIASNNHTLLLYEGVAIFFVDEDRRLTPVFVALITDAGVVGESGGFAGG